MNGAPKQVENVAIGSVIPISVPATLAVYPEMKWYAAWAGESLAIGGSTPNASHVRKTMLSGWPAVESSVRFSIDSMGYDALVF